MTEATINRQVELKASFEWIKSSFLVFREQPLQFILLGIVNTLVGIVPILGAFMSPLFMTRFAYLAMQVERHEQISLSSVFMGLFDNMTVVKLGWINACFNVCFFLLQFLVDNYTTGLALNGHGLLSSGMIVLIILIIPTTLLLFAMWLSPLICLFHPEIGVVGAMLLSFKACCFNVVTLLLYSLFVLMFTLLACIPLGLGLLIWLPILSTASYYIYQSVCVVN